VLGGSVRGIPYYVTGIILLYGILFGRLICGFLCPFGFVQDLLYRIKAGKMRVPRGVDAPLRKAKYVILVVFVILLPLTAGSAYGAGIPWFCKFICPAGTLQAGLPLMAVNEDLRLATGVLFAFKLSVLAVVIIAAILIYRPFCKYLCPLGAIYGLLNRWSFYGMQVDKSRCVGCGACEKTCKMDVEVRKNVNSPECIRCGACKSVCPGGAIRSEFSCAKKIIRR
jgi:polyferredoxin